MPFDFIRYAFEILIVFVRNPYLRCCQLLLFFSLKHIVFASNPYCFCSESLLFLIRGYPALMRKSISIRQERTNEFGGKAVTLSHLIESN